MTVSTFCSVEDVRRVIPTSLNDNDITFYIESASAEIIKRTGTSSVSDDEDVAYFKYINAILAGMKIANTQPHTIAREKYREVKYSLPFWQREVDEFYLQYEDIPIVTKQQEIGSVDY